MECGLSERECRLQNDIKVGFLGERVSIRLFDQT